MQILVINIIFGRFFYLTIYIYMKGYYIIIMLFLIESFIDFFFSFLGKVKVFKTL